MAKGRSRPTSATVLPVVARVLSQPMTRQMQIDAIAEECRVPKGRAETYLERGREILARRRRSGVVERDEQLERLRRAMAQALVGGKLAVYASLEATFADVAGTKPPRRTEVTGADGGPVQIETWADLAKLGERATAPDAEDDA